MPTVEKISEDIQLGEGPHWDVDSQSLYFVDVSQKQIARYTPSTKKLSKATLDQSVPFIIPVEGKKNQFIIGKANELLIISWDGESDKVSVVKKLLQSDKNFNDAKCDSSGRLWTGDWKRDQEDFMKTKPVGSLYSFTCKEGVKIHADKISCSNGIAINEKTNKMFYIDTLSGSIDRFDVDFTNGTTSNRQVWFTLKKSNCAGYPDGMTIDSDGNLWVAAIGGNAVLKVDGSRKETLLDTIKLPATHVLPATHITSVNFGGPNLDELYVTSAFLEFGGVKVQPSVDGALYKVTGLGVRGLPANNFKLD